MNNVVSLAVAIDFLRIHWFQNQESVSPMNDNIYSLDLVIIYQSKDMIYYIQMNSWKIGNSIKIDKMEYTVKHSYN